MSSRKLPRPAARRASGREWRRQLAMELAAFVASRFENSKVRVRKIKTRGGRSYSRAGPREGREINEVKESKGRGGTFERTPLFARMKFSLRQMLNRMGHGRVRRS